MENRHVNLQLSGIKTEQTSETKRGLTPRELIHYHIDNPDEPITDEDMENLILHTNTSTLTYNAAADTADNRMLSDNDIQQTAGNVITTRHNILRD